MRDHARVTLVAVAPPPWPTVAFAGICARTLEGDALAEAAIRARRLAARLPDGIPYTTHARCGAFGSQLIRLLAEQRVDLLVVAPPRSGRLIGLWTRRTLRRLAQEPFDLIVAGSSADHVFTGPTPSHPGT